MKIRLNPHRHCAGFFFTSSKSTTSAVDQRTAASEGSLAIAPGAKYAGIDFGPGGGSSGSTISLKAWAWIALAAVGVLVAFKLLFPKRKR